MTQYVKFCRYKTYALPYLNLNVLVHNLKLSSIHLHVHTVTNTLLSPKILCTTVAYTAIPSYLHWPLYMCYHSTKFLQHFCVQLLQQSKKCNFLQLLVVPAIEFLSLLDNYQVVHKLQYKLVYCIQFISKWDYEYQSFCRSVKTLLNNWVSHAF